MRYVSSRGGAPAASFEEALLAGYCADGGLYVPQAMPSITPDWLAALGSASFVDVAAATLRLWIAEAEVPTAELSAIVRAAFGTFHHADIAPVIELRDPTGLVCVVELFHGQTLAFKDFGQGLVCALLEFFARRRNLRVHVLVSTTGDTGPAAIEAVRAHCKQVDGTLARRADGVSHASAFESGPSRARPDPTPCPPIARRARAQGERHCALPDRPHLCSATPANDDGAICKRERAAVRGRGRRPRRPDQGALARRALPEGARPVRDQLD